MIEFTTIVGKIGSDGAVEIPEEELRRHNIVIGDEVKVSIQRLENESQEKS